MYYIFKATLPAAGAPPIVAGWPLVAGAIVAPAGTAHCFQLQRRLVASWYGALLPSGTDIGPSWCGPLLLLTFPLSFAPSNTPPWLHSAFLMVPSGSLSSDLFLFCFRGSQGIQERFKFTIITYLWIEKGLWSLWKMGRSKIMTDNCNDSFHLLTSSESNNCRSKIMTDNYWILNWSRGGKNHYSCRQPCVAPECSRGCVMESRRFAFLL